MKSILIIIFGIIIVIGFSIWNYSSQEDSIREWAISKNYKIDSIKSHLTSIGTPFYFVHKNRFIFEVWITTDNDKKEHWWIRKCIFEDDYIKD